MTYDWRVTDERLEDLRSNYAYLVHNPGLDKNRLTSDKQHLSLLTELQRYRVIEGRQIVAHVECTCPECDDPDCPYNRHDPLTLREAYENCLSRLRDKPTEKTE